MRKLELRSSRPYLLFSPENTYLTQNTTQVLRRETLSIYSGKNIAQGHTNDRH